MLDKTGNKAETTVRYKPDSLELATVLTCVPTFVD